ncbi:hypothetical protein DOTSEDRAFT_53208 [Dothistroma septosporum NZE10]|uniref:EF-hand domain-containing protein n=1 Tax=Dothistroma septosporum (strain NZE10 / CBS 128990) TaxID=675120 RepID=N1PNG7_DOTSN|nr:hypothetical protein DOTSEDRAFT_53208 [Dothistroma septosporum NZE10]
MHPAIFGILEGILITLGACLTSGIWKHWDAGASQNGATQQGATQQSSTEQGTQTEPRARPIRYCYFPDFERRLSTAQNRLAQRTRDLDATVEENNQANVEIRRLRDTINKLQAELAEREKKKSSKSPDSNAKSPPGANRKPAHESRRYSEDAGSNSASSDRETKSESMNAALARKQRELEEVETKLKTTGIDLSTKKSELSQANTALEFANAQAVDMNTLADTANRKLKEQETKKTTAKQEYSDVEQKVTAKRKELDRLDESLKEEKRIRKRQLDKEMAEQKTAAEQQAKTVEEDLGKKRNELKSLNDELQRQKRDRKKALDKEIADEKSTRLQAVSDEVEAQKRKDLRTLDDNMKEKERQDLKALKKKVEDKTRADFADIHNQTMIKQAELADLQNDLTEAESKKLQLKIDAETAKQASDRDLEALKAIKLEVERQVAAMQASLEATKTMRVEEQRKLDGLTTQTAQQQAQLNVDHLRHQRELPEATNDLQNVNNDAAVAQKLLADAHKQLQQQQLLLDNETYGDVPRPDHTPVLNTPISGYSNEQSSFYPHCFQGPANTQQPHHFPDFGSQQANDTSSFDYLCQNTAQTPPILPWGVYDPVLIETHEEDTEFQDIGDEMEGIEGGEMGIDYEGPPTGAAYVYASPYQDRQGPLPGYVPEAIQPAGQPFHTTGSEFGEIDNTAPETTIDNSNMIEASPVPEHYSSSADRGYSAPSNGAQTDGNDRARPAEPQFAPTQISGGISGNGEPPAQSSAAPMAIQSLPDGGNDFSHHGPQNMAHEAGTRADTPQQHVASEFDDDLYQDILAAQEEEARAAGMDGQASKSAATTGMPKTGPAPVGIPGSLDGRKFDISGLEQPERLSNPVNTSTFSGGIFDGFNPDTANVRSGKGALKGLAAVNSGGAEHSSGTSNVAPTTTPGKIFAGAGFNTLPQPTPPAASLQSTPHSAHIFASEPASIATQTGTSDTGAAPPTSPGKVLVPRAHRRTASATPSHSASPFGFNFASAPSNTGNVFGFSSPGPSQQQQQQPKVKSSVEKRSKPEESTQAQQVNSQSQSGPQARNVRNPRQRRLPFDVDVQNFMDAEYTATRHHPRESALRSHFGIPRDHGRSHEFMQQLRKLKWTDPMEPLPSDRQVEDYFNDRLNDTVKTTELCRDFDIDPKDDERYEKFLKQVAELGWKHFDLPSDQEVGESFARLEGQGANIYAEEHNIDVSDEALFDAFVKQLNRLGVFDEEDDEDDEDIDDFATHSPPSPSEATIEMFFMQSGNGQNVTIDDLCKAFRIPKSNRRLYEKFCDQLGRIDWEMGGLPRDQDLEDYVDDQGDTVITVSELCKVFDVPEDDEVLYSRLCAQLKGLGLNVAESVTLKSPSDDEDEDADGDSDHDHD